MYKTEGGLIDEKQENAVAFFVLGRILAKQFLESKKAERSLNDTFLFGDQMTALDR